MTDHNLTRQPDDIIRMNHSPASDTAHELSDALARVEDELGSATNKYFRSGARPAHLMTTDTDALRALIAGATPGPWAVATGTDGTRPFAINAERGGIVNWGGIARRNSEGPANAALIAAAVNALPGLLDELDALRVDAERWRWFVANRGMPDEMADGIMMDTIDPETCDFNAIIDAARAAIATADAPGATPCCGEWKTCTRHCLPLLRYWRGFDPNDHPHPAAASASALVEPCFTESGGSGYAMTRGGPRDPLAVWFDKARAAEERAERAEHELELAKSINKELQQRILGDISCR